MWGKCRQIFHTWSIWGNIFHLSYSLCLLFTSRDLKDCGFTGFPWPVGPVVHQPPLTFENHVHPAVNREENEADGRRYCGWASEILHQLVTIGNCEMRFFYWLWSIYNGIVREWSIYQLEEMIFYRDFPWDTNGIFHHIDGILRNYQLIAVVGQGIQETSW